MQNNAIFCLGIYERIEKFVGIINSTFRPGDLSREQGQQCDWMIEEASKG